MRQTNHRDLISQFQCQCQGQKSMLCLKILADSVGHVQKWLTDEKAERQCRTDWKTPQVLAVEPFPFLWLTWGYTEPLQYMFLPVGRPWLIAGRKVLLSSHIFSVFCSVGIVNRSSGAGSSSSASSSRMIVVSFCTRSPADISSSWKCLICLMLSARGPSKPLPLSHLPSACSSATSYLTSAVLVFQIRQGCECTFGYIFQQTPFLVDPLISNLGFWIWVVVSVIVWRLPEVTVCYIWHQISH